jgi:ATP-dependent helicase/nuclease subunit A
MTMHRAKGLEFHTVVLPGIGRDPPSDSAQALHWLERVAADGAEDLLLSPTLDDEASKRLNDFVRAADAERDRAERARLLYVATTRARERLHLVCQLPPARARPHPAGLLALLWPIVGPELEALAESGAAAPTAADALVPVLRRLTPRALEPIALSAPPASTVAAGPARQFALPFDAPPDAPPDVLPPAAVTPRPEFEWASPAAAHVGTVVHRALQRIAELGVESWRAADLDAGAGHWQRELRLLGVDRDEIVAATARVVAAVRGAVEHDDGRWVLGSHAEARSELKLTLRAGERLEHVRLDRTFVADGARWIVDFKTSSHEGGEREAFLASEVERYRPQLDRYAAAFAAIDSRPVRVALYFPLLRTLRAWDANAIATP